MTSRKMLATLVAAGALFALPTASQAGGLEDMHDCLFGWTSHFRHDVAVKGAVHKKKAKKVKKAKMKKAKKAAMPKK